jgi:hypothetical protein
VSLVRWAARPLQAATRPRQAAPRTRTPAGGRRVTWLVLGCYLLGAVALTWHLWADPAGRAQVVPGRGVSHDIDLFAWFLRYEATSIAHGRLPDLVTAALNAPQGVNLMWNTSFLLPGVVFAPLTLAIGPQATLTVLLTLGFAGSAATMFWVLRRWSASLAAAALGGAVFGFSPALRIAAVGHYHLQFAVLLPLIIDALLRLVTGRGRPVRTGAWLGLLTAAQLFIAEETVALTAVAGAVIVVVLAASRPRAVPPLVRGAVTGLAAAAGVLLVTAGYPLWIQFHGPLAEQGSPWKLGHFRNRPGDFVNGPSGVLLHSQATVAYLSQHAVRMVEYFAYLGWPMLAVLLLAAVCFWRDLRVRALAVAFAVLEVLSLGSRAVVVLGLHIPATVLPWHYLQGLPLLSQSLPNRFSLLADGAAAVVLAFSLDLAWGRATGRTARVAEAAAGDAPGAPASDVREADAPGAPGADVPGVDAPGAPGADVPGAQGADVPGADVPGDPASDVRAADALDGQAAGTPAEEAPATGTPADPDTAAAPGGPPPLDIASAPARAWRRAAAVALLALAIGPIIPLPLQTAAVTATPAGWQQVFARLRLASGARVLVVPLQAATVMRWQADTGVPGSVIGGYCIAPTPGTGQAELCGSGRKPTADYLNDLWLGKPGAVAPSMAQLRADLRYWRPAAIVAVTSRGSRLGQYLSNVFGPPALQDGSVLAWRPVPVPRAIGNRKGSPVNS